MLLANYAQVNRNVARDFGCAFTNPLAVMRPWHYPNFYTPDTAQSYRDKSAFPHGANTHYAYSQALTSGGIASINGARGVLTTAGAIAGGRNIESSITMALTTSATGQAVVSGVGAASMVLSTSATLTAILSGSGSASATLTTSGTLSAVGHMEGSASMALTTSAAPGAIGHLEGNVNMGAIAVDAVNFSTHLLDEEDVETGLTLRQALRVIAAAAAGKVSGAETTTITFRNAQADTVDRIVATVDSNGNRTNVVLDVS